MPPDHILKTYPLGSYTLTITQSTSPNTDDIYFATFSDTATHQDLLPNMCGLTVYAGRTLPEVFHNLRKNLLLHLRKHHYTGVKIPFFDRELIAHLCPSPSASAPQPEPFQGWVGGEIIDW